jgi:hypothetical protein
LLGVNAYDIAVLDRDVPGPPVTRSPNASSPLGSVVEDDASMSAAARRSRALQIVQRIVKVSGRRVRVPVRRRHYPERCCAACGGPGRPVASSSCGSRSRTPMATAKVATATVTMR